jgi:hypothetical protein
LSMPEQANTEQASADGEPGPTSSEASELDPQNTSA